eukprot:Sdes_comp20420_c0_seq3m14480
MIYTGIITAFTNGIYTTMIAGQFHGFPDLPSQFKPQLIGLSICFNGLGEMTGGAFLGKLSDRFGKKLIFSIGLTIHCSCFVLFFLNFFSKLFLPQVSIAIFCSFLFGLGDAAYNTQLYSLLGNYFPTVDSPPAFSLFKLFQSGGTAFTYSFLGKIAPLYHSVIGIFSCLVATFSLFLCLNHSISSSPQPPQQSLPIPREEETCSNS